MPEAASPVVVALLVTDPASIPQALSSVAAQTQPVRATYLVGADAASPGADGTAATVLEVVERAPRDVTHVWLLHSDAAPRPDALAALLREAERIDASVAGSKLLDAADPDHLESVGGATDVFDFPYTGLQPDEIDQEQYDVVRDVAFAPGASVLVRRDLLRGLGGPDPLLEPGAAEIDFSQRARLAGGRVIVVPSSEVLHAARCRTDVPAWRRAAGRYRAVAKAYQLVTLVWVLPVALILGLVEAVVRTFTGRPLALVDEARAWTWNLLHVGSLVRARRSRRRLVGDEELFRYQVGGSAGLRLLAGDLTERSLRRAQATGRPVGDWMSRGARLWATPGFAATISMVLLALVAVRSGLLGDLPASGFALPLLAEPGDAIQSVFGGWNLGGLGSPRPLHPSVLPQALLGFVFSPDSTRVLLLLAGIGLGTAGFWRLASELEMRAAARFAGAAALVAGPAVAAALGGGYPAVLGAVSTVPLVLLTFVRQSSPTRRGRIRSILGMAVGVGVAAWFLPLALVAVPLIGVVLAATGVVAWRRLVSLLWACGLGAAFVGPYLLWVSVTDLVTGEGWFWDLGALVGGLLAGSVVIGLVATDGRHARVVGAGGLLLGVGAIAARAEAAGAGREVWAAGLLIAAVGVGLVAAGLIDGFDGKVSWLDRAAHSIAAAAVVVAVAMSAGPMVWSGAVGLPDRDWTATLEFTEARAADHGPDRTLIIGLDVPGDHRTVLGTPYRVLIAPGIEEAFLDQSRPGDTRLEETLTGLYSEVVVRPGQQLAALGIRWVVLMGSTPFDDTFASVLDVRRLPIADVTVFENLEPSPVVATGGGVAWSADGLGFTGAPSPEIIMLQQNAEGWDAAATDGWAMVLDGSAGFVSYASPALISAVGMGGLALAGLLAVAWVLLRSRT